MNYVKLKNYCNNKYEYEGFGMQQQPPPPPPIFYYPTPTPAPEPSPAPAPAPAPTPTPNIIIGNNPMQNGNYIIVHHNNKPSSENRDRYLEILSLTGLASVIGAGAATGIMKFRQHRSAQFD